MKVYISGKISGIPTEQVKEKFARAEEQIRAIGHEPVNPLNNGQPASAPWRQQMKASLAMMFDCDAVYLLTDYLFSRGARVEAFAASEAGMVVMQQPVYAAYNPKTNQ